MKKQITFKERLNQLDLCVTAEDYRIVVQLIKDDFAEAAREEDEARTKRIQQLLDDTIIQNN